MRLKRDDNAAAEATLERTTDALREHCGSRSCADLCRRLNAIVDAKTEALKADGAAVACAPGCDYCCHMRVSVFAHEAAALVYHLRSNVAPATAACIEQQIRANAARIDALTPAEHRSAGIACALLSDGRCSAHEVRPLACATYHSLSRERCADAFRDPCSIGTSRGTRPALLELHAFGAAQIAATKASYDAVRRPAVRQELHQALRDVLAREDEAFAGPKVDTPVTR